MSVIKWKAFYVISYGWELRTDSYAKLVPLKKYTVTNESVNGFRMCIPPLLWEEYCTVSTVQQHRY